MKHERGENEEIKRGTRRGDGSALERAEGSFTNENRERAQQSSKNAHKQ